MTIQFYWKRDVLLFRNHSIQDLWDRVINQITFVDKRRENIIAYFKEENVTPINLKRSIIPLQFKDRVRLTLIAAAIHESAPLIIKNENEYFNIPKICKKCAQKSKYNNFI